MEEREGRDDKEEREGKEGSDEKEVSDGREEREEIEQMDDGDMQWVGEADGGGDGGFSDTR